MTTFVVLAMLLSACGGTPTPEAMPLRDTPTPRPPTATPEPTPDVQRLVICASEPQFASPFTPSQAGMDLLALFHEPAIERVGYVWEPRLVTHVPALASGDVATRTVPVPTGTRYTDEIGNVLINNSAELLQLPQLVVTFTLKSDLRWSDGDQLTAEDMILGYHLAQSSEAYGEWKTRVERTARFISLDRYHIRWEGLPGYLTADYAGYIFPPQPAHRWQGQHLEEVLEDRTPPATGPYRIVAWEAGREVRLEANPYFAGETPSINEISYRFPQQDPSSWHRLLQEGECDVMMPDPVMATDWLDWETLMGQGAATIHVDVAPVVLRLDLNITPQTEEPSPLVNPQVRQALVQCIDRQQLSRSLPGAAIFPATTFVPPGHPAYATEVEGQLPFDPEKGAETLDLVGWRDEDGDGFREAHDVTGFKDGEPLSLTLHLAPQYFLAAAHVAADLDRCGIGVLPQPTDVHLLYASNDVSPLFGRTFQMALFGWQSDIPQVCGAWLSDRIPEEANGWAGENFSGYRSPDYDAACRHALTAITPERQHEALAEAQTWMVRGIPTIFLTWRPYWFVARPGIQGIEPQALATGALWNAEALTMTP